MFTLKLYFKWTMTTSLIYNVLNYYIKNQIFVLFSKYTLDCIQNINDVESFQKKSLQTKNPKKKKNNNVYKIICIIISYAQFNIFVLTSVD